MEEEIDDHEYACILEHELYDKDPMLAFDTEFWDDFLYCIIPDADNYNDNCDRRNWREVPEEVKRCLFYLDKELLFKKFSGYALF